MQERELHFHGARVEVHLAGLALHRAEQALALDDVVQVEELALRANAADGIGPFEPAFLAQDVELPEAPVEVDLLLDLALLLGDTRQALIVLPALGLGGGEVTPGARQRFAGDIEQREAAGEQRPGEAERADQAFPFLTRKGHGSLRASTTVKRGASLESPAPMSPLSTPSGVTSKGSW